MSFGQPSDLVVIFKIAKRIHDYQFDRNHNASRQCADLQEEAEGLEQALLNIYERYKQSQRLAAADDDAVALQYAPPFLGLLKNCKATLQECETILFKFGRPRKGLANLAANVGFDLGGNKEEVNRLKEKLHKYTAKFLAMVKPFELKQASDTHQEVMEIRSELRQNIAGAGPSSRTEPPSIPPAIDDKFSVWWLQGPIVDDEKALAVLQKYVKESKIDDTGPTPTPLPQHKLSLAKAQWIHTELMQRPSIVVPGSTHHEVFRSLSRQLRDRYQVFGITHWTDQIPDDLDISVYRIWPEVVQPRPPDLTAPCGPTESRLTSVNLVSEYQQYRQSLTVLHSGESRCRIVEITKPINGGPADTNSEPLDLRSDRVIPFYASGDLRAADRAWTLSIGPKFMTKVKQFSSKHDLNRVQQAFTGYSVPFSWDSKDITIVRRRIPAKQDSWTGDIQVWWYGTNPRYERKTLGDASPSSSDRSRSIVSETSASRSSDAARFDDLGKLDKLSRAMSDTGLSIAASFQTLDASVVTVTKLDDGEELVIGQRAHPPILVGLCQDESRYSMWSANLANFEPSKVFSVKHKRQVVWRVELEKIGSSEKLRSHTVERRSRGLEDWDLLSLLRDPKQKSKADEPPPCAKSEDFHSLILSFDTREGCEDFLHEIMWTVSKYQDRIQQLRYARKNAQSLSDRPRAQSMSQTQGLSFSNTTLTR